MSDSIRDLLEDSAERKRLNKYIDWQGIKDYKDFKSRIKQGFDTKLGKSFFNAMSENNLKRWWEEEQGVVIRHKNEQSIVEKGSKFGRDYSLGSNRRGKVFIVKKGSYKRREKEYTVYRDPFGRFSSIKSESRPFTNGFSPGDLSWARNGSMLSSRSARSSRGSGAKSEKQKKSEMRSQRSVR